MGSEESRGRGLVATSHALISTPERDHDAPHQWGVLLHRRLARIECQCGSPTGATKTTKSASGPTSSSRVT